MSNNDIEDKKWEEYFYPNTKVLKNKYHIMDQSKEKQQELHDSFARILQLYRNPIAGPFDTMDLQMIHEYIFQDIYDWAGKFRTTNIEKNGCMFEPYQNIESRLKQELKMMHDEEKNIHSKHDLAIHLARYFTEIMYIHPFREGNGRAIREFIREYANSLSKQYLNGQYEFLWNKINNDVMEQSIHFSLTFRSAIELEFEKALIPCEPKEIIKR